MALTPELAWLPVTKQEKELVLAQLQDLLASHAFRNSQRYPALLRYVVEQTLAGEADLLKERTLGIAVFHRQPDYDTNADPVVRISAGEVRKRLAQYYQEHPHELRIELPPGSYVPHFFHSAPRLPEPAARPAAEETVQPSLPARFELSRSRAWPRLRNWLSVAPLFLLLAVAGIVAAMQVEKAQVSTRRFWAPLGQSQNSLLLVLGDHLVPLSALGRVAQAFAEPMDDQTGGAAEAMPPLALLPIGDAQAFARVAAVLGAQGIAFNAQSETSTSLEDLRSRPAVLFGAFNNQWSIHATHNLRFRFERDYRPDGSQVVSIVDTASAARRKWSIVWSQPLANKTNDYAIVARFFDPENEKEVVLIAGLGENGTVAAGEFVTNKHYLAQLDKVAPFGGWSHRNLEAVIATPVVNGLSGPPHVEAVSFW